MRGPEHVVHLRQPKWCFARAVGEQYVVRADPERNRSCQRQRWDCKCRVPIRNFRHRGLQPCSRAGCRPPPTGPPTRPRAPWPTAPHGPSGTWVRPSELFLREGLSPLIERLQRQPRVLACHFVRPLLVHEVTVLDGPHAGSDGPLDAFHAVDVRTHVRSPVRCGLHDRTDLLETGRPPAQGDRRGVRGADISVSRRLGDQRTAGEDPRPREGSRVDGLPQPERGLRRRAPWLQPRRSVESASATAWAYISPVPASSMVSILLGAKIMCQCASDMPGMRARPSASIRRAPSDAVGGSSEASQIFDPVTRSRAASSSPVPSRPGHR